MVQHYRSDASPGRMFHLVSHGVDDRTLWVIPYWWCNVAGIEEVLKPVLDDSGLQLPYWPPSGFQVAIYPLVDNSRSNRTKHCYGWKENYRFSLTVHMDSHAHY